MTPNAPSRLNSRADEARPAEVLADLIKWLRDTTPDTDETEAEATGPREDFPLETAGFDPFEFQLANGNDVRLVFARFWERLTLADRREGARPSQYYALKVYSTEDTLPRRMAVQCEFRAGKDVAFEAVPRTWEWLDWLLESRQFIKYDSLDEFIEELAERIADFSDEAEDAVEHIAHIAEATAPEAFEHEADDSIYNDQNEPERPER
jgi:hypothetical protein